MSAAEIVNKTGLPRSYIYQCLRGEPPGMTISTVERLCAAIGLSPAELWERKRAPAAVIEMNEAVGRYLKGKQRNVT